MSDAPVDLPTGRSEEASDAACDMTAEATRLDWRAADRTLRTLARRRAALDADEAAWLVRARDAQVHVHLGFASFLEYVERVLGYAPHVARERLRIAEALPSLPATMAALRDGALAHSAVRELTRIITPATEQRWLTAANGATVRQIEEMVSGRRPGDLPDDPPLPGPRRRVLRLELSGETLGLFAAARRAAEDAVGHALEDDDLMAALCECYLARDGSFHVERVGAADAAGDAAEPPVGAVDAEPRRGDRPPYQIAITRCEDCRRTWSDAAGGSFEVDPTTLELASCDADHLGRVDGQELAHLASAIPPATRRAVLRRDRGRCVVPGCRNRRHLHVHHVTWRSRGGDHSPEKLATLCSAHHRAIHRGLLSVEGEAPDRLVFRRGDGEAYATSLVARPNTADQDGLLPHDRSTIVPPRTPMTAANDRAVRASLVSLGFTPTIATAAVQQARTHVGQGAQVDALMTAALRACPRPGDLKPAEAATDKS